MDGSRVERGVGISTHRVTRTPSWRQVRVGSGGLRLGTPRLTHAEVSPEEDFVKVADYIKKGIDITVEISKEVEGKKFGDFKKVLDSKEFQDWYEEGSGVFVEEFPTIGFDKAEASIPKARGENIVQERGKCQPAYTTVVEILTHVPVPSIKIFVLCMYWFVFFAKSGQTLFRSFL